MVATNFILTDRSATNRLVAGQVFKRDLNHLWGPVDILIWHKPADGLHFNLVYFFIWHFSVCFDVRCREGNEPGDELTVTYRELLQRVCQFANVLKSQGKTTWSEVGGKDSPRPPALLFTWLYFLCVVVCRSEEGRPCLHLHAHGGGAGGGHVGLCPYRSRSLHSGEL